MGEWALTSLEVVEEGEEDEEETENHQQAVMARCLVAINLAKHGALVDLGCNRQHVVLVMEGPALLSMLGALVLDHALELCIVKEHLAIRVEGRQTDDLLHP